MVGGETAQAALEEGPVVVHGSPFGIDVIGRFTLGRTRPAQTAEGGSATFQPATERVSFSTVTALAGRGSRAGPLNAEPSARLNRLP